MRLSSAEAPLSQGSEGGGSADGSKRVRGQLGSTDPGRRTMLQPGGCGAEGSGGALQPRGCKRVSIMQGDEAWDGLKISASPLPTSEWHYTRKHLPRDWGIPQYTHGDG